jgi:hypothetical protein
MDLIILSIARSGHNFVRNNIISWKPYEKYFNLETIKPKNYNNELKKLGKNKINNKKDNIIVVRDLLNWLSSYLKFQFYGHNFNSISRVYDYCNYWELITKEGFNETNYLSDKVTVIYDLFKVDRDYRKNICNKIGGYYNENNLDIVTIEGNGSSFDYYNYQKNGNKMNTEKRYQYFINSHMEHIYLDILKKRPRAVKLYKKYFNLNREQLDILKKIE